MPSHDTATPRHEDDSDPGARPPRSAPSRGETLTRRASEVRQDALRHLSALAGDASMCAIGRSGGSFPAAKYHEGRQAAATQLRRALHRATDPERAVDSVVATWQQTVPTARRRGGDWSAYAAGGLDALAEITDGESTR